MRKLRATIAACAVAVAAMASAGPASAGTPDGFYGMDSILDPTAKEFRLMAASGVEVFRMPLAWKRVEPDPPRQVWGQTVRTYNWRGTDRIVRRASKVGIDLHVGLIDSPRWLFPDQRTSPMQSEAGKRGWQAFVAAVMERYGPEGEYWDENPAIPFNPPVTYQIWNEVNTPGRYQPKPDPAEYAKLLRLAGREINTRDREATILPAGMFGTPLNPDSIRAWIFMRKLLRQPAVKPFIDGVAIHPYSPNLRGVRYQIRKMRSALRKEGQSKLPLYVTELGWSSTKSDRFFFFKGKRGQARLLKRSFKLMHEKRRKWKLKRIMWFAWRDANNEEVAKECFCDRFGLVTERLKPKPALRRYRRFSLR